MTKNEDKFTIPEGVLSDLCSRFIINVPEEERSDLIRIFFQIEIAHWFYLDFYCDSNLGTDGCSGSSSNNSPTTSSGSSSSSSDDEDSSNENLVHRKPNQHHQLKPCSIRTFAENIFRHCPFLMQHSNQVDDILSKWKVFKHAVPTNGAIILDETMRYVLLVQGFWAKASWGFPKGKVFEEESEAKCAQREVLEETGYDITSQLVDDQYLQININDQTIRLYIVTGVSKKTEFAPRTRREIKEVRWFPLEDLPMHRKDTRCKQTLCYSPNSFFMVIPFVKALKQWISIKNGSLDGQIVNGTIVTAHNSASKFLHGANRPHSTTISHKRHNSTSQQNQQQFYQNNHHNHSMTNNHNQHQHHHNSSQNFGYTNYKKLSKSNENLASLGQNINTTNSSYSNQQNYVNNKSLNNSNSNKSCSSAGAANSKSLKFNFKSAQNNPFLKHYTAFNSNAYNNVNEPISPITGDCINNNNNSNSNNTAAASVALNIKQQSQYYHKIQQSEFADLLGFKEAAIANKNKNKQHVNVKNVSPINNNSNNNISLNSNSKFKPVNSNINTNSNTNTSVNNSNKKSNNSNLINNTTSLNNQHHSYSTPAALSINNNITNTQHIHSNNNNNNTSNSNRKNHSQQPNLQSQSQNSFKDLTNNNNNMLKNSSSLNYSMNHYQQQHHHQYNTNNKLYTNPNANHLKRVKKQLEFNGPECWINFKFDYDAISQVLPQPLLAL